MKLSFEQNVRERIETRKHLIPVFSHVYDIPRRVHEYDPSFFVVLNENTQKYEIHSLDYPGDQTHSCTIPFDELDCRTLYHLWENDIRVHGKEIFRRLERQEEEFEKRKQRETQKFNIDFAKEFQSAFAKDAWA